MPGGHDTPPDDEIVVYGTTDSPTIRDYERELVKATGELVLETSLALTIYAYLLNGTAILALGAGQVEVAFQCWLDSAIAAAAAIELQFVGESLLRDPPRWDAWSSTSPVSPYRTDDLQAASSWRTKVLVTRARVVRDSARDLCDAVERAHACTLVGDSVQASLYSSRVPWLRDRARSASFTIADSRRTVDALTLDRIARFLRGNPFQHRVAATSGCYLATFVQQRLAAVA